MDRPGRAGASLIELLVVILIISILAALLLPALESARDAAMTVDCQNRMRELAHGIHLFADDHTDYIPCPAWRDPNGDYYREGWDHTLPEYLGEATYDGIRGNSYYPRTGGYVDPSLLKFYCQAYEALPDHNANYPWEKWESGNGGIATWGRKKNQYCGIGSYQMNGWLDFYGMTTHNNRYWQLPNPWAKLYDMLPSTMLMAEISEEFVFYYNPRHGNRTSLVFSDGHTELRERGKVPESHYSWSTDFSAFSADRSEFRGWHMLVNYPNPQYYNWKFPPNYRH